MKDVKVTFGKREETWAGIGKPRDVNVDVEVDGVCIGFLYAQIRSQYAISHYTLHVRLDRQIFEGMEKYENLRATKKGLVELINNSDMEGHQELWSEIYERWNKHMINRYDFSDRWKEEDPELSKCHRAFGDVYKEALERHFGQKDRDAGEQSR